MRTVLLLILCVFAGCPALAGEPALPESSLDPSRSDGGHRAALVPSARVKVAIPANGGPATVQTAPPAREPLAFPQSSYRYNPAGSFTSENYSGMSGPAGSAVEPLPTEPPAAPQPKIMAFLQDREITEEDVTRELWAKKGRETFDWMVGKAVLEQELARLGASVAEAEVEERLSRHMEELARIFPGVTSREDLARAASGMGLGEYRERSVWAELALRKIMRETLKPTDEQLRVYFAERRSAFVEPERARISQIFISPAPGPDGDVVNGPEERAEAERQIIEAHSRLRVGEDFLAVASSYASGTVKPRWVERGELMRELEEAAFSLRAGAISAPIRTSMGYHIIKVEERRERKAPHFEDVRERVLEEYEDKFFLAAAGEFMTRLKEKALRDGRLVLVVQPDTLGLD